MIISDIYDLNLFHSSLSKSSSTLTFANAFNMTGHDVLIAEDYEKYVIRFNAEDNELYHQYIPNSGSWDYLQQNIPLFDCPDKEFEMTYYFRWWVYRKHIKKIEASYVTTAGIIIPVAIYSGLDIFSPDHEEFLGQRLQYAYSGIDGQRFVCSERCPPLNMVFNDHRTSVDGMTISQATSPLISGTT